MTIRKTLSTMIRLLMLILFVVGLVWVIRFESLWTLLGGILLMLLSVPLSYELAEAIENKKPLIFKSVLDAHAFSLPVVGPMVLLFVFMSSLSYYAQTGDARGVGFFLLLVPPLASVLIDVMQGERAWRFADIFSAWLRALIQMYAKLLYLAGGLLLLIFVVLTVVSLFISLGDLIRQWLLSGGVFEAPVLCSLMVSVSPGCNLWLPLWHALSLLLLLILWRYGSRLLKWVDSIFIAN